MKTLWKNTKNKIKFLLKKFILTDGLYDSNERKEISKIINSCIYKDIIVFGIGVGFSPFGIQELFPNVIYAKDPKKLIQAISDCFNYGIPKTSEIMSWIELEPKIFLMKIF